MTPKQLKLDSGDRLSILWDDGHQGFSSLKTVRDHCPCASCQGETVLMKTYLPILQPELPGKYKLVGAESVGSYAIGMSWGDGHRTGIYTYERLRSFCECPECSAKQGKPVSGGNPA
jgi:DUF971 family protein